MTTGATGPIVIPLGKGKIVLLVLGAVVFVALGTWLFLHPEGLRQSPAYVKVVSAACVAFFGACSE